MVPQKRGSDSRWMLMLFGKTLLMLSNAAKGIAWAMEAVAASNFHSCLKEFLMKTCQASAQVMDSDQVVGGETIFR